MINKRIAVLLLTAGAITLLAQCSPKASRTVATNNTKTAPATPADKIADIKGHYTAQQIEEGQSLFNSNCAKCHKMKMPETRTVEQWEQILPRMSKKAGLSEAQHQLVRAYVLPLAKME